MKIKSKDIFAREEKMVSYVRYRFSSCWWIKCSRYQNFEDAHASYHLLKLQFRKLRHLLTHLPACTLFLQKEVATASLSYYKFFFTLELRPTKFGLIWFISLEIKRKSKIYLLNLQYLCACVGLYSTHVMFCHQYL
jgi:hypothetical protein